MEARRFDQISRGLAAVASRRTTLGGGVGAVVAALLPGLAQDGAVKKKKKCKQAKKCAGKVCGNFGCKGASCGACEPRNTCEEAICSDQGACIRSNVLAGTPCGANGQQCNSGECIERPTCAMEGAACTSGDQCCSNGCWPEPNLTCFPSGQGEPCLENTDCGDDLVCVGYRCAVT